ncbi:MAG: sodium:calcium antiporter [Myxococcota bacterium]
MLDPTQWPLALLVLAFACVAGVIGFVGVRMTRTARDLAYETGMGEALMGALFIGASTSLSGITTSVVAASGGHAELAVSNGLGGIAAQTCFLAIADIAHRRVNLEHAAASAENLFMAAFLMTLLALHGLALAVPERAVLWVHPATLVILLVYVFGVRLLARTHQSPMWIARRTSDTPRERAETGRRRRGQLAGLWLRFTAGAAVVAVAGWALATLAVPLGDRTGLSDGLVGGVFTAVSTSIPELVVAVSAVRMGAVNLAVGDIIGGNAFDTLFISASDVAYTGGSIYAAVSREETFWLANSLVMTGVLLMGLIYRERHGPGNIGVESVALFALYLGGLIVLATGV